MVKLTFDELIKEGEELRAGLKEYPFMDTEDGVECFYKLPTKLESKYEKWKQLSIRFLQFENCGSQEVEEFKKAISFERNNIKKCLNKLLAILEACKVMPKIPEISAKNSKAMPSQVTVYQNQQQSQDQKMIFDIFLDSIKGELTEEQKKELKEIANNKEKDPQKVKSKIKEKIKSFGVDVATNILANIITNPSIWSKIFSCH